MIDYSRLVAATHADIQTNCSGFPCITIASVLQDVLHALGASDAYCLASHMKVFSPAETRRLGHDPAAWAQTEFSVYDGALPRVVLGETGSASADEWHGHLVVIVPNGMDGRDLLLDLSIERANQPAQGILLRPITMKTPLSFAEGGQILSYIVNQCRILYKALPDNHTFENKTAWRNTEFRQSATQRIVRAYQKK